MITHLPSFVVSSEQEKEFKYKLVSSETMNGESGNKNSSWTLLLCNGVTFNLTWSSLSSPSSITRIFMSTEVFLSLRVSEENNLCILQFKILQLLATYKTFPLKCPQNTSKQDFHFLKISLHFFNIYIYGVPFYHFPGISGWKHQNSLWFLPIF